MQVSRCAPPRRYPATLFVSAGPEEVEVLTVLFYVIFTVITPHVIIMVPCAPLKKERGYCHMLGKAQPPQIFDPSFLTSRFRKLRKALYL